MGAIYSDFHNQTVSAEVRRGASETRFEGIREAMDAAESYGAGDSFDLIIRG